jgi:hypothetical protein
MTSTGTGGTGVGGSGAAAGGSGMSAGGAGNGAGGATGSTKFACYTAMASICNATFVNVAMVPAEEAGCTQFGGVAGASCPTDGLLGCCNKADSESCFYAGGSLDAAMAQANCQQGNGTWSVTP